MRVRCKLRVIMEELELKVSDLKKMLGIDERTIEKLLADGEESWRLDRDKLYKLMLFAHEHDHPAFEIEPHPIWRTFQNSQDEITVFRGFNTMDAPVEDHLRKYFERLNAATRSTTTPDGLEEAMKSRNCVIIGSPKLNHASEKAFALLWGAKPSDSSQDNRERIPVHFLGMKLDPPAQSATLRESTRHGLHVRPPGTQTRQFVRVDWLSQEKYETSTQDGQEAAVLVVCNRPLGTELDVTTIIIAGFTGLSTLEAAREATYKEIPNLFPSTSGMPLFAILKFQYRKRARRAESLKSLRTVKPNTARWAPPWDSFFDSLPP